MRKLYFFGQPIQRRLENQVTELAHGRTNDIHVT